LILLIFTDVLHKGAYSIEPQHQATAQELSTGLLAGYPQKKWIEELTT
jgi:hypothetical protein